MVITRTENGYSIACTRKLAFPPKCQTLDCPNDGKFLCDFVVNEDGNTCDRRFCVLHGSMAGFGKDYCVEHADARFSRQ